MVALRGIRIGEAARPGPARMEPAKVVPPRGCDWNRYGAFAPDANGWTVIVSPAWGRTPNSFTASPVEGGQRATFVIEAEASFYRGLSVEGYYAVRGARRGLPGGAPTASP